MGLWCLALVLQRQKAQRGKGLPWPHRGEMMAAWAPSSARLSWALLTGPSPMGEGLAEKAASDLRHQWGGEGGAGPSPPRVTLRGEGGGGEPEGGVIRGLTWEMRQP